MPPPKRRTISQRSELLYDLHTFGVNLDAREIFIHSSCDTDDHGDEPGVDYRMATMFEKNLRFLHSSDDPVIIHMHTVGGHWNDGIAIYDTITASKCHITIIAYAHARSMSSIILQAADVRILMPNTDFMIHYGSTELACNTISAQSAIEWDKTLNQKMLDIYIRNCNQGDFFTRQEMDDKQIKEFLDRKMRDKQEWYLNANDAVKYGFADGVLGDVKYPDMTSLRG